MSQYRRIARICRAKGLGGEVVVTSDYGLSLRFWDDVQLYIVPPEHELPRTTTVTEAKQQDDGSFILKLVGIDNKTDAQMALGHYLLALDTDDLKPKQDDASSVVGMQIVDVNDGPIGTVIEERRGGAQDIWVVEGTYGEVLIPAAQELIVSCSKHSMTMDLPSGLLELNR